VLVVLVGRHRDAAEAILPDLADFILVKYSVQGQNQINLFKGRLHIVNTGVVYGKQSFHGLYLIVINTNIFAVWTMLEVFKCLFRMQQDQVLKLVVVEPLYSMLAHPPVKNPGYWPRNEAGNPHQTFYNWAQPDSYFDLVFSSANSLR